VIPRAATGRKSGNGIKPGGYMGGDGSLTPPLAPGTPTGNKPASIAGTGVTPPTYARSARVPDTDLVGDYASGAKTGIGNPRGAPPEKVPGQNPPSGYTRTPAARTGPDDKSKSVGVE
jgi:hypothetical protein